LAEQSRKIPPFPTIFHSYGTIDQSLWGPNSIFGDELREVKTFIDAFGSTHYILSGFRLPVSKGLAVNIIMTGEDLFHSKDRDRFSFPDYLWLRSYPT
jgi:hypothetical protein